MYARLSSIMFPIVTVMLAGALMWGYQEHQEKNQVLIKAENQYQRAFHDLTFHMEKLHEQLGHTLAVNTASHGFQRKGLVNVWRLTSQAQNEISQLPLTYLPFTEAEDFLSHISNFAYKTAIRDLTKQPLSEKELGTLKTLYAKSDEIAQSLQKMQEDVISSRLRWMDVEMAIAAEHPEGANPIADGLRTMDKKVGEYPELDWGPSVTSMYERRSMKMLGGNIATADEIKRKAAKFMKTDPSAVEVTENGKGTEYASYSATVGDGSDAVVRMDFAQKGGQLIWFMKNRDVGQARTGIEQAKAAADQFLAKHGFDGMSAISLDRYQHTGIFTYVGTQNGVLIYPEKLTVKVALDNGEVVGMQANDYVYEHRERELPSPILTEAEARQTVNPGMDVRQVRLALIDGDGGDEVLCYEFTGRMNGSMYRLYVNAETGIEEQIETMSATDTQASGA